MSHRFTETTLLLLFAALPLVGGGCRRTAPSREESRPQPAQAPLKTASKETVVCPVCGLEFSKSEAVGHITHQRTTYFFYLKDHLVAFRKSPEAFVASKEKPADAADSEKNADSH